MKILADENITRVAEFFAPYGEVVTVPGRSISSAMLRDVDALLVRSITRVDGALLQNTPCRFVGTATSGLDHIDVTALQTTGITLGWAQGCNSISVVDYIVSALAHLSQQGQGLLAHKDWRSCSAGIIGCGQIGGALARRLDALGITFRIHDPFLTDTHPYSSRFAPLDEVLQQDIITLHVPLTIEGPWPTFHMLNDKTLGRIPDSSILINAARGSVIDNRALLQWMTERPQQNVVLDTWENEPDIDLRLLQTVQIGTAHIAGYSYEGKLKGTTMLLEQFCSHFGFAQSTSRDARDDVTLLPSAQGNDSEQLNQLLLRAYDIGLDHQNMLGLLNSALPGRAFDDLRKHYRVRHEYSHFALQRGALNAGLESPMRALGFQLVD